MQLQQNPLKLGFYWHWSAALSGEPQLSFNTLPAPDGYVVRLGVLYALNMCASRLRRWPTDTACVFWCRDSPSCRQLSWLTQPEVVWGDSVVSPEVKIPFHHFHNTITLWFDYVQIKTFSGDNNNLAALVQVCRRWVCFVLGLSKTMASQGDSIKTWWQLVFYLILSTLSQTAPLELKDECRACDQEDWHTIKHLMHKVYSVISLHYFFLLFLVLCMSNTICCILHLGQSWHILSANRNNLSPIFKVLQCAAFLPT